jgi:hypothetical protein
MLGKRYFGGLVAGLGVGVDIGYLLGTGGMLPSGGWTRFAIYFLGLCLLAVGTGIASESRNTTP